MLDHLVGKWVLTGEIGHKKTTHDISAEWVLEHQYLEIHETSRERKTDGAPAYDATIYIGWDAPTKRYACVWLDDFGDISTQSIGRANLDGDSIPFVFIDVGDDNRVHTTFAYQRAANRWTMNIDQGPEGNLQPFARTVLVPSEKVAQ